MTQAKEDYRQFCRLFEGQDYENTPIIVADNGCTYGAIGYDEEDGLCDINYKSICASIGRNDEGKIFVYEAYEIYDENGMLI